MLYDSKKCVIKQSIDVFLFVFIPDRLSHSIISEDHFPIRYVPDQYKLQQMCDKAVYFCLATLKFVPDWFVTRKIIK